MDKLLTINEAAEVLQLKPSTIYMYVCQRKIPFVKIQSSVRFRPRDLEVWVERRFVKPLNGGGHERNI